MCRVDGVGIEPQRLGVMSRRLFVLPLVGEEDSQVVMPVGVAGIKPHRLAVMSRCLFVLPSAGRGRLPGCCVRRGIAGIEPDGLGVMSRRLADSPGGRGRPPGCCAPRRSRDRAASPRCNEPPPPRASPGGASTNSQAVVCFVLRPAPWFRAWDHKVSELRQVRHWSHVKGTSPATLRGRPR